MQKIINAKTIDTVKPKGRKLEYKKVMKIDEAKTYEKVVVF